MNATGSNLPRGNVSQQSPFVQIPIKPLIRDCIIIGSLVAVGSIHRFAMLAVFAFLAVFALRSTLNAIKALSVLFLLIYLNPVLNIANTQMAIFRWGVFFAATGRIYYQLLQIGLGELYRIRPIFYLHVFCGLALFSNMMGNPFSPVGYLKLFAFTFGVTAVFAGVALNQLSQSKIFNWLLAVTSITILCSVPFLATGAGYYSKSQSLAISESGQYVQAESDVVGGFMGILGHSQSFGAVSALMTVFLFITIMYSRFKPKLPLIALMLIAVIMVYLSKARTGGLGMLLAMGFCFIFTYIVAGAGRKVFQGIRIPILPIAMCFGLLMVSILAVKGGEGGILSSFINKGRDVDGGVLASYQDSRGALMQISMNNFYNNKVFGIGFGRSSWDAMGMSDGESKGILALAFSPNEKGMILTAVLEETGIVGFTAFVFLIGSFLMMFVRQANIYGAGIFVTVILLNLGEMSLFSMGGLGMIQWVFIAISSGLADKCSEPIGGRSTGARLARSIPRKIAPGF